MDEEKKFIARHCSKRRTSKANASTNSSPYSIRWNPKKAAPQLEKMDKDLVVAMLKGLKQ